MIKKQLAEGVKTRRVGFVCTGAPARAHSEIQTPEGETVRPVLPSPEAHTMLVVVDIRSVMSSRG